MASTKAGLFLDKNYENINMPVNYKILKTEIATDPLVRGYGNMTDGQIAGSLNAKDRSVQRESISGDELFGYTDETEYLGLSVAKKSEWLSLCAIVSIPKNAVPIIKSIFNNLSTTWSNIVKTKTVSRLEEIGAGTDEVSAQEVFNARTGSW